MPAKAAIRVVQYYNTVTYLYDRKFTNKVNSPHYDVLVISYEITRYILARKPLKLTCEYEYEYSRI